MMKALVILAIIAASSAFPADDNIPPKDIQPLSLPLLPPGAHLAQGTEKPKLPVYPTDDKIPLKDILPLSPPLLPTGAQLPLGTEKPQPESGLEGPPGDKSQDDLKADNTFWFGYGYPSYRRSYYSYYTPRVYSYYGHSHWSPYYHW